MGDSTTLTKAKNKGGAPKGNSNGLRHGAFQARDNPEKLPVAQRSRYLELRQALAEQPGRDDLRAELAANLGMLCEIGFSTLSEINSRGDDVWESPVIRTLGGYLNLLARLLDNWPKRDDRQAVLESLIIYRPDTDTPPKEGEGDAQDNSVHP